MAFSSDSDQLRSLPLFGVLTASYPLLSSSSLFQYKFSLYIYITFGARRKTQYTGNTSKFQVLWNQGKEILDLDGIQLGYFWFDTVI